MQMRNGGKSLLVANPWHICLHGLCVRRGLTGGCNKKSFLTHNPCRCGDGGKSLLAEDKAIVVRNICSLISVFRFTGLQIIRAIHLKRDNFCHHR